MPRESAKKKQRVATSDTFAIESDVPVPLPLGMRKYPLEQMQIGDSFFIPAGSRSQQTLVAVYAKRYGIKVITRTVEGGIRVWRVEKKTPE